jgi:hypothetical protein
LEYLSLYSAKIVLTAEEYAKAKLMAVHNRKAKLALVLGMLTDIFVI